MVSQARMSTRITLTMFFPPPKSYGRAAGSPTETGRRSGAPGPRRRPAAHHRPTASAIATPQPRSRGRCRSVNFLRQPAQHQHEDDEGDGLDQELGERQVGRARAGRTSRPRRSRSRRPASTAVSRRRTRSGEQRGGDDDHAHEACSGVSQSPPVRPATAPG